MAVPTFNIKQGDTAPAISSTLLDATSAVVSLVGATVRFHMADSSGTVIVDALATIVGPAANGVVSHAWLPAETAAVGTFGGEWEVTFTDGTIETFPNNQNITITITPAIVNP